MADLCFCHLNGYAVKDATARREIEDMQIDKVGQTQLNETVATIDASISNLTTEISNTNTRLDYLPDNATELTFDNIGTGLTATNTRDAILEVKGIASSVSQGTAIGTTYNNTSSGLTATNVQGAIDELASKVVSGTLATGETSLTITDASITTDSMIDVYTNIYGVNPTELTVATGSITLMFDAQESDLGVKVRVM